MNDLANGAVSLASMGFTAGLVIVGLIAWFFINRASVRASQQVQLLEALLEEQKRQNALLRRLTDSVAGKEKAAGQSEPDNKDFTRLIPER
ncbi:YebO family protein [Erwinia sp. MMLR14_017]|uniref:YebO family protein n=1 Tax=Erwinia sp. MMLR14_017 TaxID=3093842 RepID=UPI00298FC4BD|nr:YebO family protein [Erwinia sp. MMLR14_017]MDW8846381.1 YebO family protein [Erwinia sp. MMLR14_017]